MREKNWTLIKILLALSAGLTLQSAFADEQVQSPPVAPSCENPAQFDSVIDKFDKSVFLNLQKEALTKSYALTIKTILLPRGGVLITDVQREAGSLEDLFYCKEAIWNSVPLGIAYLTELDVKFTPANRRENKDCHCVELFFQKHPDLRGAVVVMHIVPVSVDKRARTNFSYAELHSLKNLVAVPISKSADKYLDFYHQEFTDVLAQPEARRAVILSVAEDLLWRYRAIFTQVPPPSERLRPESRSWRTPASTVTPSD